MSRSRVPVVVVVGVLGGLLAVGVVRAGEQQVPRESVPAASAPTGPSQLAVLREWDRRRARAYAAGSPSMLRDLYVQGSTAGASDVRLLRDYRARGFRVVGMRMQVLSAAVLEESRDRVRVRVTDRLHDAVAVGNGRRITLPRDQATERVVTLTRGRDGRWVVVAVGRPS